MKTEEIAVTRKMVSTKLGCFEIVASNIGIAALAWPDSDIILRPNVYFKAEKKSLLNKAEIIINDAAEHLLNFINGNNDPVKTAKKLFKFPVDYTGLSPFAKDVYKALRSLPPGRVISYGELGFKAGYPQSARAVGTLMRKNPVPLFIPCHKVVSAHGKGGWSGPPLIKEILLKAEGYIAPYQKNMHRP
jgi:methylated-DNA-[protein]-cysteine S-methyltransferase